MNTRAKILLAIALFFTIALGRAGFAAEYYVDRNNASASDSNAGSETNPWLTIQKAANTMVAGDTCYVKTGVYDERIRPANCGEEGNLITYKAVGNAVVRGFLIEVKTHLRIIGFEITHTINNAYSAVQLYSADYCVIENNNIHHTYGMGIYMHKRYPTNNGTGRIRSCSLPVP